MASRSIEVKVRVRDMEPIKNLVAGATKMADHEAAGGDGWWEGWAEVKAALAALNGSRPAGESGSFPARFDGLCAGCGTSIFPGQLIVRTPDGGHRHDLVGCLP